MLEFLVFLIVLILLFGANAVLGALLGVLGWIVGIVAVLGFVVWVSTTYDVDVAAVMMALVLGIPAGWMVLIYVLFSIENLRLPREKRQTFAEFLKAANSSNG